MAVTAASPTASPSALRRHWRLAAFLLCSLVPFAPSIWAMQSFLLADNALGFVPFMLPAAAYLFWVRTRLAARPAKRDVVLDCFFAGPAIITALFLLFLTPAKLSWYFWLYRVDLFAMALVALAVGFVFLGYQQVLRAWQAFLLLFLVWPYPVVALQDLVSEPMTAMTVLVARGATSFLQLPYTEDGGAFTSRHLAEGDNFSIALTSVCSGSAVTMGFLLVGLFLVMLMRGPFSKRLRWLALGVVLAYVSNLVRVVALLVASAYVSFDFGFEVLHPILGLVLFGVVVLVMLALMRPYGLALTTGEAGAHRSWEPVDGGGRSLQALQVATAAVAVLTGVFVFQAQTFAFLGAGEGAPTIDVASERTILPTVEGWNLDHYERIGWTDLFGESSRGDLFGYGWPSGPIVVAQVIIADDVESLERYSIEQCIIFHRSKVESREYVVLPHGMTGVLVHDTYQGIPSAALYWQHPVRVDGEVRHVRIALLLDIEEPTKRIDQRDLPVARTLAERYGNEINSIMDGNRPKAGDPRANVDLTLVELGSRIVERMVGGTGAASAAP